MSALNGVELQNPNPKHKKFKFRTDKPLPRKTKRLWVADERIVRSESGIVQRFIFILKFRAGEVFPNCAAVVEWRGLQEFHVVAAPNVVLPILCKMKPTVQVD